MTADVYKRQDINNAEDVYVADVNGDGIINVVDATLIQKYLVRRCV